MAADAATGRRPGWYHGWNVVGTTWLACIGALGLPLSSVTMFLGDWERDLHASVSEIMFGVLLLTIVVAVLSPIVGTLSDRYAARPLIAFGVLCAAAGQVALSYATNVHHLWLVYASFMPAAATMGSVIPANSIISRWFVRRIGLALGIVAGTYGAGAIVLPPIIALLLPVIGWRGVWRGGGAIVALVVLPLVLTVLRDAPDERDDPSYLAAGAAGGHMGAHAHGGGGAPSWGTILRAPSFWVLIAIFVPVAGLASGIQNLLAPIAASHGLAKTVTAPLLSLFAAAGLVITILAGMASDRFGSWRPMIVLSVLLAIGSAALAFGGSMPMILIGTALAGSGAAIWPLVAAACAGEFGSAGVGRAYGAIAMTSPVTMGEVLIAAKMAETSGSYVTPVLVMAALVLGGAAVALVTRGLNRGPRPALVTPAA